MCLQWCKTQRVRSCAWETIGSKRQCMHLSRDRSRLQCTIIGQLGHVTRHAQRMCTHVLVRNDFHALHVTRGLEYLLQHILGHPRIEASHVQRALVGLWSSTPRSACRREDGLVARLRDAERWQVGVRAILVAWLACTGTRGGRRRQGGAGGSRVVGHGRWKV